MELKDVLHFYFGCECKSSEGSMIYRLSQVDLKHRPLFYDGHGNTIDLCGDFKPILRPLSDMTEDEESEIEGEWGSYGMGGNHLCNALKDRTKYVKDIHEMPGLFLYLLSRHFDLFGLIESGLAIDKTKQ